MTITEILLSDNKSLIAALFFAIVVISFIYIIGTRNLYIYKDRVYGLSSKINMILCFLLPSFWIFLTLIAYFFSQPYDLNRTQKQYIRNEEKAVIFDILNYMHRVNIFFIPGYFAYLFFRYPNSYFKEIGYFSSNNISEDLYDEIGVLIDSNISQLNSTLDQIPEKEGYGYYDIKINYFIAVQTNETLPISVKMKPYTFLIIIPIILITKLKNGIISVKEFNCLLAHEMGHIMNLDGRVLTTIKSFFESKIHYYVIINFIIIQLLLAVAYHLFGWVSYFGLSLYQKLILIFNNLYSLFLIILVPYYSWFLLAYIIYLVLMFQVDLRELLADTQATYLIDKNDLIETIKKYGNKRKIRKRVNYLLTEKFLSSTDRIKASPFNHYIVTALILFLTMFFYHKLFSAIFFKRIGIYFLIDVYLFSFILIALNNEYVFYLSKSKLKELIISSLTFGLSGNGIKFTDIFKIHLKNLIVGFPLLLSVFLLIFPLSEISLSQIFFVDLYTVFMVLPSLCLLVYIKHTTSSWFIWGDYKQKG